MYLQGILLLVSHKTQKWEDVESWSNQSHNQNHSLSHIIIKNRLPICLGSVSISDFSTLNIQYVCLAMRQCCLCALLLNSAEGHSIQLSHLNSF